MEPGGYIKLHRVILDSWLWTMPAEQRIVAITLLLKANWRPGSVMSGGRRVEIPRGSTMTSLESLSKLSGVSIRTVRSALHNLENGGFLTRQTTNRNTVISIVNYDTYQEREDSTDTPTDKPATSQRQASDKPATTIEEGKKERREEGKKSVSSPRAPARDMGEPDKPSEPPADRYAGLYRLWCDKGQRATEKANANPQRRITLEWKPLPEINIRHRIAEALNSRLCLGLSNAQIAHGLEMLVAEGLAKPIDDPDPFRWLRECWDGRRLSTAVGIPSADAARERATGGKKARGSPGRPGKVTASDMFDLADDFDRFQREESDGCRPMTNDDV